MLSKEQRIQLEESIAKEIHSDQSPVGIDAKKTHILILAKLEELGMEISAIKKQLANMKEQ